MTLGSTTESGYTSEVLFTSSPQTPVEDFDRAGSLRHHKCRRALLGKRSISRAFLVAGLTIFSLSGLVGTPNIASAAELVATFPGVGSTVAAVPPQVVFGFDAPLEKFGTAVYVNGKRVRVGVAERGRNAQEAVLSLGGLTAAGTYEVFWEATAADGTATSGKIRFVVKIPARKVPVGTASPPITPTPTTPAPPVTQPAPPPPAEQPAVPVPADPALTPSVLPNPVVPPADGAQSVVPAVPDPAPTTTQTTVAVPATKATVKPKATQPPRSIAPAASTTAISETVAPDAGAVATPGDPAATPSGQRNTGTEPANAAKSTTTIALRSTKVLGKTVKPAVPTKPVLPERAATTPTLGNGSAIQPSGTASGSAEIIFESPTPAGDPQDTASGKGATGKPGAKAPTTVAKKPGKVPATKASNATVSAATNASLEAQATEVPTTQASTPAPTLAPSTTRPKPTTTTTTTTILLSPDTVPATDIEVSFEGPDGSLTQEGAGVDATEPSTTRKRSVSLTETLEGTTSSSPSSPSPSTALAGSADTVAPPGTDSGIGTAGAGSAGLGGTGGDSAGEVIYPGVTPDAGLNNGATDTIDLGADRPRTEAEIVSGTDASNQVAEQNPAVNPPALQTASNKLRNPLRLAGVGTLAALLLGLAALFASLRAPITAFARQRWLTRFGSGLLLGIVAIAAFAVVRELLASPKSWPRIALKVVGFSALTAFAFIRRRILRRGVSTLNEILPSAKHVRVPTSADPVAAALLIDEQVPKSLRLGDAITKRSKGRHVPELVQRLRKASTIEALFGAIALLAAGALLLA